MIVLSHIQIAPLLRSFRKSVQEHSGGVSLSSDLGLTLVTAVLSREGVLFPDGERLTWTNAEVIADDEVACFALESGSIRKIQMFSSVTNRHCSLMPTTGAPTLLIAGFPMHRIKGTDPQRDTMEKIKAARPTGRALDTSMGLGYTAIHAARAGARVTTIELDPAVVEVAGQNPWSRELFTHPQIERIVGDSFDYIESCGDGVFNCILHDPPTMQLAGDLYSGAYYRELARILTPQGRLFHYIGDLKSQFGARIARGVTERLKAAGFKRVVPVPQAFGINAFK
ncbi:MAG: methyltransferase domain-containing protein [Anaerolineae bacterium]|nr:methyltransferase domain-containing protein [Anaerolineae bacterium]NUQ03785.1 methyltransferase domain-containing protein [Anaerolineae bacterium]